MRSRLVFITDLLYRTVNRKCFPPYETTNRQRVSIRVNSESPIIIADDWCETIWSKCQRQLQILDRQRSKLELQHQLIKKSHAQLNRLTDMWGGEAVLPVSVRLARVQ